MRKYSRHRSKSYKGGRRFSRTKSLADTVGDASTSYSAPNKEGVSTDSELIQRFSYRGLQNISSIDVKMDPNTQMAVGSYPYTIIGSTNAVSGAVYPGTENIAGNTITQIQNNTSDSQLMNIADSGVQVKTRNYLYLPIRPKAKGLNIAYLAEVCKSVDQATAFGQSTMLTQLAFYNNYYVSDLPVPPTYNVKVPAGIEDPTDIDGLLQTSGYSYTAALIHYQTVLQNIVRPISKYTQIRSLERELMRMSWRTEAPILTQLFGLLKKASLMSAFNTLGTVVINEYFDDNWYNQSTMVDCYCSRKTQGMVNPLLSLVSVDAIPSLQIYATMKKDSKYYDSSDLNCGDYQWKTTELEKPEDVSYRFLDPETLTIVPAHEPFDEGGPVQGKVYKGWSFERIILNVCKLLDQCYILKWARGYNAGTNKIAVSTYVEKGIKAYIDFLVQRAALFSTRMSNIRTFLDRMQNAGMVYWKKGLTFFVPSNVEQITPSYNVLVASIFSATHANGSTVEFDDKTKRWRFFTLWNKYEGIPEYDKTSGGSFLTFGLRNIDTTGLNMSGSAGLIPVLFVSPEYDTDELKKISNTSTFVARNGIYGCVTAENYDSDAVKKNPSLCRLNPLSTSNLAVKEPVIDLDSLSPSVTEKRIQMASALLMYLATVYGYGKVKNVNGKDIDTLDPDYVCFLDDEVSDVSNDMIVFARNYAPFRVSTPNTSRTVGFISHKS